MSCSNPIKQFHKIVHGENILSSQKYLSDSWKREIATCAPLSFRRVTHRYFVFFLLILLFVFFIFKNVYTHIFLFFFYFVCFVCYFHPLVFLTACFWFGFVSPHFYTYPIYSVFFSSPSFPSFISSFPTKGLKL